MSCGWSPDDGPASVDADQPPDDVPATGTDTLTMTTGQGVLTLTLDRAQAPCAAAALTTLAGPSSVDQVT